MAKAITTDLLPLPAVRLLLDSCTVTLEPMTHQISSMPKESGLEYYFVPAKHMRLFSPYHRPDRPFKNLKLLNYDRPAISISFYNKHKYKIDRDVEPVVAQQILQAQRDELYGSSFLEQLSTGQQQQLQYIDNLLRSLRDHPADLNFCISNYHQFYRYWYCSYRYFDDVDRIKTSTSNEHMLKHTQRAKERSSAINERLNIIFVDMNYMTRPVPYDNKLVDRELETFDASIPFGQSALYVKKNI